VWALVCLDWKMNEEGRSEADVQKTDWIASCCNEETKYLSKDFMLKCCVVA